MNLRGKNILFNQEWCEWIPPYRTLVFAWSGWENDWQKSPKSELMVIFPWFKKTSSTHPSNWVVKPTNHGRNNFGWASFAIGNPEWFGQNLWARKNVPIFFLGTKNNTSWWFFTNPSEKICASQIGNHVSKFRDENNKYLRNHHPEHLSLSQMIHVASKKEMNRFKGEAAYVSSPSTFTGI